MTVLVERRIGCFFVALIATAGNGRQIIARIVAAQFIGAQIVIRKVIVQIVGIIINQPIFASAVAGWPAFVAGGGSGGALLATFAAPRFAPPPGAASSPSAPPLSFALFARGSLDRVT
jgi:hypothetical protein